jgi:hypothetical protein
MRLNWGATIPFPEKFLYNKRDISPCYTPIIDVEIIFITFEEGLFEVLKGLFTLSSTK